MLTRRAAAYAIAAGVLVLPVQASVAQADDSPVVGSEEGCEGKGLSSFVTTCVTAPGAPAGGGKSERSAPASRHGSKSGRPATTCHVEKLKPQPPADSVMWEGHKPSDGGAIYTRECFTGDRIGSVGPFWSAKAPGAQTVDPAVVARQAVDRMRLSGPDIQSPRADGRYVVGMPMWLHVRQAPTTFGPNSASAAAGGVQVTARAKVVRISWGMGDGSRVVCDGPGAAYRPRDGQRPSPDCGHVYRRTSAGQDDGKYTLTATSTWQVDWNGAGQQGQFTETRTSQVHVPVGEVQALG